MIESPIASRRLVCQLSGESAEAVVSFGRPVEEPGYFVCEYEITLAGETETYQIAGLDSLQALQLAMFMVGSFLQSYPRASEWMWNNQPLTGLPTSLG